MKQLFLMLLSVGLLIQFGSCKSNAGKGENTNGETDAVSEKSTENKPLDEDEGLFAELYTTKGKIVFRLYFQRAPMTVANFVGLAEGKIKNSAKPLGEPFYDGIIFHRVIPNFMIQTGDPNGNGTGGPGYKFPDEFNPELRHSGPGIVSMANSGPNTNGSQFFITHKATPHLDNKHTVFGKVVEGQDVVVAIGNVERDKRDKPLEDVVIKKVKIIRKGKAAKKFDAAKVFKEKQEELKKAAEAKKEAFQKRLEEAKTKGEKTLSGLTIYVTKKGDGPMPKAGQTVTVHYTGYLTDGSKFDSSVDRGQPFQFNLGEGRVIKGWEEGFSKLHVGDKATLIIPSQLGYGERGYPPVIPGGATLVFDVELLGVN